MRTQEIPTFSLREQDAMAMSAPAGGMEAGAPPMPGGAGSISGGSTTNDEHMKRTAWHMNMTEEEFEAAIAGGTITVYRPYDFSATWGFHVAGPIEAVVEKRDDGESYNVTFLLENLPQNKFYLPYSQGNPAQYEGPHPNQTEVLSKSDIQNQMAAPLDPEAAQRGNEKPPEPNPMQDPGMADSGAPGGGASDTGSNGLTPTG